MTGFTMALQPYSDRAHSAQRNWDNQEDPRFDQEHRAEQAADLAKAYRTDPAKLREAEEQTAGTFSGTHYTEVSLALHRLHHTDPADLMGGGMSGYEIKVSITPLCPCCGKESQSSGFVAESRAPQGVFDRDNPYERTDQRVFISPCTDCFAPRVALNAAADALQHARDWIEEA
uniref:DPH-type MB domain-containing protein n=1 Tax=Heterorhabditis bacteriophora TaxID=37862 RepID=A0A1I7WD32_HETBA